MLERSLPGAVLHGLFALICMVVIALALGAVWVALALHFPSAAGWFALPLGLVMGYATRAWVTASRTLAMTLAAAGTLLAAIYMQCLFTGLRLAAVMGLGYLTTLRTAGAGMLLALARTSFEPRFVVVTVAGMLLALAVAGRKSRFAQPSIKP